MFVRPDVTLKAARCRYFHHDVHSMMYHLIRPGSPYRLSRCGGGSACAVSVSLWLCARRWPPAAYCNAICQNGYN